MSANATKIPQLVLRNRLKEIRGQYDYTLIDCLPSLGVLTINAFTAANYVLIPTATEYLSEQGYSHAAQYH